MSWSIFKFLAAVFFVIISNTVWAQCGVTMSCGTNTTGPIATPGVCTVQACFANQAAKQKYEQDNSCKFPAGDLCGDKPIDKATQCCGKDAGSGAAKIKGRQNTSLDGNFDWSSYQKECPEMRQSEATPDGLWAQCVVGQLHDPNDDKWPVREVISFPGKPSARPYCVDGCSTPPSAVNSLYATKVFMARDKDNPSGFPTGSFYGACAAHDVCYQSCVASYTQAFCDQNLLNTSLEACATIPPNHQTTAWNGQSYNTRDECVGAANAMNTGLSGFGGWGGRAAFNKRKQQYCQCC